MGSFNASLQEQNKIAQINQYLLINACDWLDAGGKKVLASVVNISVMENEAIK